MSDPIRALANALTELFHTAGKRRGSRSSRTA